MSAPRGCAVVAAEGAVAAAQARTGSGSHLPWRRPLLLRRSPSALVGALTIAVACAVGCHQSTVSGRDAGSAVAISDGAGGSAAGAIDSGFTVELPEAGADVPAGATAGEPDCTTAAQQRGNAGCDFFPTQLPVAEAQWDQFVDSCYAVFVVNPGKQPAHLTLSRAGQALPLVDAARIPQGEGATLSYGAFDPAAGLPAGQVAMLFLAGSPTSLVPCPAGVTPIASRATSLVDRDARHAVSGIGKAFHLSSDRPVVAYQITPYSGGKIYGITSATLLLPRESWGTTHYASTPSNADRALVMVTAGEDDTEITVRATVDVVGGGAVQAAPAGTPLKMQINAGDFVQLVDAGALAGTSPGLSGSVISASKPVSVISGADQFFSNSSYSSAQQQIPPIEALGNEYVAVKHRNRTTTLDESEPWQAVGAADGTILSYVPAPPAGAPTTLNAGQVATWSAKDPFVIRSQDADHPFELMAYMSGWTDHSDLLGDPEFVTVPATGQYVDGYTFFTDPTYHQTSLVVVRKRGTDGQFADVHLGCAAAPLAGFKPVGDFELAWVNLASIDPMATDYQMPLPGCDNGRQTMDSTAPFAVTVWGWTPGVSYAYPAGASTLRISNVKPPIIN